MEGNNIFLTPQLGQEMCTNFVRATGVSLGSKLMIFGPYATRVTGGSWDGIYSRKNRLGANVLCQG